MKKLEETIIKRHHIISLWPFISLVLEFVSERRRAPRGERNKARKGRKRKEKEGKGSKGKKGSSKESQIKRLQWEYLQGPSCMYDFLNYFGMHGRCMGVFSSFVFIGLGFLGLKMVSTFPFHLWTSVV